MGRVTKWQDVARWQDGTRWQDGVGRVTRPFNLCVPQFRTKRMGMRKHFLRILAQHASKDLRHAVCCGFVQSAGGGN